jgi:hypothetical protein
VDLLRARIATAVLVTALASRADFLSPGPLSKSHEKLEGLSNCTSCHAKGSQVSEQRCLDCHSELGGEIAAKKGFHGSIPPAQLSTCNACHHEHQGKNFKIIEWPGGDRKRFDHRKTGYVLEGKHAQLDCNSCHLAKLVVEPNVRTLIAQQPQRTTFLGLGTSCQQCHFDEHRGQLAGACTTCHTQSAWKPAPGFSHAKTDFALRGKHASVDCLKCHARTLDADVHKDVRLPPHSEVFQRFLPVAHSGCLDCHKDPHDGRLGNECASCHTVDGWHEVRGASGERAFHEKTRYPLRGAHVDVACRSCHGPFPGVAAVYKGLRFDSCNSCHVDAHLAQLGSPPPSCDQCHSNTAFLPARFELAQHKGFALQGSHAAVACSSCHKPAPALAAKAKEVALWVSTHRRSDKVSLTNFHPPGATGRCDACHVDPHAKQFAERVAKNGCADCHQVTSFAAVRFDHSRDSRFALEGPHENAQCAACHVADAKGVVRYKPLSTACASCHADPHEGQFAQSGQTDCTACHQVSEWKKTRFVHAPPFTGFVLEGKHAEVACTGCHRDVRIGQGAALVVRQYRGVPVTCAGCHVDVHKGAFQEISR